MKVLFFSGSVGLGHVTRDLVIANELRRLIPNIQMSWLAADPATQVIEKAGEIVLPEAKMCSNLTGEMERVSKQAHQINQIEYTLKARRGWEKNVEVFKSVLKKEHFDLIIGDETYEISIAFKKDPGLKNAPYVWIGDFIGIDAMGRGIKEKLVAYFLNRLWAKDYKAKKKITDLDLFVGELEDIPDKPFGFLLPNRREYARRMSHCIGYILPFRPANYTNKGLIRKKLGMGDEPLVICSVGGTAVGRGLLELCGQAYPLAKEQIPNLRMILVAGPRIAPESLRYPYGVEVKGYVPALYEYLAMSDLAIVQGSGSTTLELTALRKPFLYFPLEGHYEQGVLIPDRLKRHRAGMKMIYRETKPQGLSEHILANLGREVDYATIPIDGAQKAAELITRFL